jgi:phosphate-selective porin OprO and OprP
MISIKKIIQYTSLLALPLISPYGFADDATTDGGFEIYRSNDDRYWFTLHGIMKVDATFFIGDYQNRRNEFPSGTNVRAIETTMEGGVGKDVTYTMTLGFDSGVSVNDAFITYKGFKNTNISVGQVISPFCLENANSGKWIPFLERSLPVISYRPCMGIGANISTWGKQTSFTIASTTVPHGTNRDAAGIMHRSDKFTTTSRFVWAPYLRDNKVVQIGVSGVYGDNSPTFRDDSLNTDGRRFSTRPEARARNTPSIINSGNMMAIRHYTVVGVEASGQTGPLLVQAEFLQTDITRKDRPHLNFYGWYSQVSYMLTGETRKHKMNNASFGGVTPRCKYGAWEVAARYSMVNMSDEDIHGGKENNVAVSLGWYVNPNLKILTNYIYASIDPTQALGAARNPDPTKRHLNIVGLRGQVVF